MEYGDMNKPSRPNRPLHANENEDGQMGNMSPERTSQNPEGGAYGTRGKPGGPLASTCPENGSVPPTMGGVDVDSGQADYAGMGYPEYGTSGKPDDLFPHSQNVRTNE